MPPPRMCTEPSPLHSADPWPMWHQVHRWHNCDQNVHPACSSDYQQCCSGEGKQVHGCAHHRAPLWFTNIATLGRKAQHHLYFLRKLRKRKAPSSITCTFYRGTIKNILSSCIMYCCCTSPTQDFWLTKLTLIWLTSDFSWTGTKLSTIIKRKWDSFNNLCHKSKSFLLLPMKKQTNWFLKSLG